MQTIKRTTSAIVPSGCRNLSGRAWLAPELGSEMSDGARDIGAGALVALIRYLILAKHSFSRSSSERTCVSMALCIT